ncbi:hypothetical protein GOODEAATRI_026598, partial [Goodea atripinnis]
EEQRLVLRKEELQAAEDRVMELREEEQRLLSIIKILLQGGVWCSGRAGRRHIETLIPRRPRICLSSRRRCSLRGGPQVQV